MGQPVLVLVAGQMVELWRLDEPAHGEPVGRVQAMAGGVVHGDVVPHL